VIIRNDDCAADTTLAEIRTFCEICDRYGVTPMHAITPIGTVQNIDCRWDNARIRREAGTALFSENTDVVEYLKGRKADLFAVHGLWHTHRPAVEEIMAADVLITEALTTEDRVYPVTHFVPPFNEWRDRADDIEGGRREFLAVCGSGLPRIEDYLEAGDPQAEIMYTHSWRYEHGPFTWKQFESCLKRLTAQ
jgi:hypothetical protein